MEITRREVQKVLNQKITQLNDIIADIDGILTKMETDFFRVSIFGSARLRPGSQQYQEVYDLAYQLSMRGVDIVTGGGPGLMEAASKGAQAGSKKTRSIGLHIELPFEVDPNRHLDVKRQHKRFSSRLDEFMRISHAVVVTPGGIGTLLELFYTWQLIQVKHIRKRPILMLGQGDMWSEFLQWIEKWPLALELLSRKDLDQLILCRSIDEVIDRLGPEIKAFSPDKASLKSRGQNKK